MTKNLKLCFFFLLSLFLLLPSLFFLPSPSQSAFVDISIPIVQNPDDGRIKKSSQILDIKFLRYLMMGIQQVKITEGEKEYTYPVDLLATTITQLMLNQRKTLKNVDLDKLQGKARKQFLNLLNNKGKLKHENKIKDNAWKQIENGFGQKYLNSFKSSLLKIQTLGIIETAHPLITGNTIETLNSNTIPVAILKELTFKQLQKNADTSDIYKVFYRELVNSFTSFGFETQTAFAAEINGYGNPWFHPLQKVSGLTHLTIGKKKVDVSSLVNSKVQEASELSFDQLQIIKKIQLLSQSWPYFNEDIQRPHLSKQKELKKFQTQIQSWEVHQKEIQKRDNQNILAFQKNWDAGEVSSYLLWLPIFDIQEVKLSQKPFPMKVLATAIKDMLVIEKFDFTKLQGKAKKQLLNLLNSKGQISAEKTFQDDIWRQIKNHKKWKTVEGIEGVSSLLLIRTLLLEVQDLGISQVSHPFFPKGYELSFLKDNPNWEKISFPELLQGMKVAVNGTNVEFASHLFPDQIVFQVPMKKLSTVFSEITITNIIKALEKAISDHLQQEKQLETKNQGLIIGLYVAGSILVFIVLGCFLYLFLKIKRSKNKQKT